MTLKQTVDIPDNRRFMIEVPREIPTGRAQVEFKVNPFPIPKKEEFDLDASIKMIQEMCKDVPISVDSFLEERRRDDERRDKKLFGGVN